MEIDFPIFDIPDPESRHIDILWMFSATFFEIFERKKEREHKNYTSKFSTKISVLEQIFYLAPILKFKWKI